MRTWLRRALAAFVALCVLLNLVAMELLRARKIPSSGGSARSAERFLDDSGMPRLGRLFGAIGYPFVQPVGWLFALRHHVPASAFENVVGNWFLDRDGQWLQVQTKGAALDESARGYVASGLALGAPKTAARVTGPVRMLLPMFAAEPIVVFLMGAPPGTYAAKWNGSDVPAGPVPRGVRIPVPGTLVHAGVNELEIALPVGAAGGAHRLRVDDAVVGEGEEVGAGGARGLKRRGDVEAAGGGGRSGRCLCDDGAGSLRTGGGSPHQP